MGFGKKLEEKMAANGLKQADLVRATGIPKTTLSSMLNRDNVKVDVEMFIRICQVLHCDPMDFADEITAAKAASIAENANIQRIYNNIGQLNDDGLEALAEYSDFLTGQGKYKKLLDIPREA